MNRYFILTILLLGMLTSVVGDKIEFDYELQLHNKYNHEEELDCTLIVDNISDSIHVSESKRNSMTLDDEIEHSLRIDCDKNLDELI